MKSSVSNPANSTQQNLFHSHPTLSSKVMLVSFLGSVCFFVGLALALLPWWLVFSLFALPALFTATLAWPFIGLLGLVVLVSGMVPSWMLPEILIGPGKILPSDMALIILLGIVLQKATRAPNNILKASKSYLIPVMLFILAIPFGLVVGYLFYGTSVKEVLNEARELMYWLICFLPLYFVTRSSDLHRIAWGLVVIGFTLAVIVVLQFVFHVKLLEDSRVENLETMGVQYSDVTRSTAGGAIYLIIFPLYYLIARMLTRSLSAFIVMPVVAVLTAGIIVSFGRGIWIISLAGLFWVAWRLGRIKAVQRVTLIMLLGLFLAVAGLSIFKPSFIYAAVDRFASTFSEGGKNSSLGSRLEENDFAVNKILSSPIFGIGFGTPYKPRIDLYDGWDQVRYIHNSYIGLWLKLGLLGPFTAAWLMVVIFRRSRRMLLVETLDVKNRALLMSCLAGFFVPVMTGITQPEWLVTSGVSFFALMTGLIAALEYQSGLVEEKML
jgi:O-antigen ligase